MAKLFNKYKVMIKLNEEGCIIKTLIFLVCFYSFGTSTVFESLKCDHEIAEIKLNQFEIYINPLNRTEIKWYV